MIVRFPQNNESYNKPAIAVCPWMGADAALGL